MRERKNVGKRIKATLGITGWSLLRVHIDGVVRHLDVGSSHPGAERGPKGWTVRPLKWYVSWVSRPKNNKQTTNMKRRKLDEKSILVGSLLGDAYAEKRRSCCGC